KPEEKQSEYPVERTYPTNKQSINTRVAYHYSKNKQTPFRFPVIPDEETQDIEEKHTQQRYTKRRHMRSQRSSHRNAHPAMVRQPLKNELDNVPAYMRRKKAREQAEMPWNPSSTEQEESLKDEKQNEVTKDPLEGYTRPDELDRVFRIRDGYHTPEKTSEQNYETNDEEIINNIPVKEAEQIRDKKEAIETNSLSTKEKKAK